MAGLNPSTSRFDNVQSQQLNEQNTFSTTEVGITNPNTPGFIRLTDTGDIEILANDGLGIIISYKQNSITLMANTIRFITTSHEGLAWNNLFFNQNATVYSQPALNPMTGSNITNIYSGTSTLFANSTINLPATSSADVAVTTTNNARPTATGTIQSTDAGTSINESK